MTKNIENFADENNRKIISKIPFDKAFAEALVNLTPIVEYKKEYASVFRDIVKEMSKSLKL